MVSFVMSLVWSIRICHIIRQTSGVSYNQLSFGQNAKWNPNATTFANSSIVGADSYGMFINTNNTVYLADHTNNRVVVWDHEDSNITKIISGGLDSPFGLFVTENGDVYVDNGMNGRVEKWTSTSTRSAPVMYVNASCYCLFVDMNNNVYCSMRNLHQILMKSPNSSTNVSTVVAGTGKTGNSADTLENPVGIFVDTNLSLYVADYFNHRIQLFPRGQLNATTIAGNGSSDATILFYPTGVVLDADGFLFIVDRDNTRIIRSGQNELRCIVGCSNSAGSQSDQFLLPRTMAFDSCGNLFVLDTDNSRIQKFLLMGSACNGITTYQTSSFSDRISRQTMSIDSRTSEKSTTLLTTEDTATTSRLELVPDFTTTEPKQNLSINISSSALSFVSPWCSDQMKMGVTCDTSTNPCDVFQPCQNGGTCQNINTANTRYNCSCLSEFNGTNCEINIRPCQPDTCWNDGICTETSSKTFECTCQPGWTNVHCESSINYCDGVQCQNNAVCRSLSLNYTCECLGTSYSGRHCEEVTTKIEFYRTFSTTTASVSIIFLISVVLFIIVMDVLKYSVGIDPVKNELKKIRRRKAAKKVKKIEQKRIAVRYIYVNQPLPVHNDQSITVIDETSV